jgi:hypothetical protein
MTSENQLMRLISFSVFWNKSFNKSIVMLIRFTRLKSACVRLVVTLIEPSFIEQRATEQ